MRSWLFLFCCNLMWALQFTCIKLVQDQVGPMFTVWGPMTLAMFMLVPFVLRDRSAEAGVRPRQAVRVYFLLAALGVFPAQVMMTWGTRLSLASNAAVINLTLPVATALFAVLFLREHMTPVRWVSFATAIIGVVLCSGIDFRSLGFGSSYLLGNALIFAGTLGSAFYNSYGKKALEFHTPMQMLFWTYVAVCSMMAPVVLVEEGGVFSRIPHFTLQTWIGMALLTFFHNYPVDDPVPEGAEESRRDSGRALELPDHVLRSADCRHMATREAGSFGHRGRRSGAGQHAADHGLGGASRFPPGGCGGRS